MNALHYKAAYWVGQGVFDRLSSFSDFEPRVNPIFEEKDRGDVFEIFIEGYLATQAITQHVKHWVVGGIPVDMRERFNLPNDGTGIDGVYEAVTPSPRPAARMSGRGRGGPRSQQRPSTRRPR